MKAPASILGAAAMLVAARADAAGATWWIDASEGCEGRRAAFQREVALACEAVGGTCRVVSARAQAELVAALECESGAWALETRTVEGSLLSRVDLESAGDDRLREAAVEVARDAAPERTLVAEELRDSMSGVAAEQPKPAPRPPTSFAFALSPRGSIATQGAATAGIGGALGLRIQGSVFVSGAFAFEGGGAGTDAVRVGQGGVGFAYGAPFDRTSIFGTRFEAGARGRETYVVTSPGFTGAGVTQSPGARANTQFGAYGLAAVNLQWPGTWVRPIAGLSLTVADPFAASAEIGVVMDLF